ncbi:glycosyltransferase [Microbacterium marinum]|uniref:glycosyltransferase n=1 Tax=Microbacterium marinum TaxID=421115 RepID=UPI00384AC811
MHIVQIAPFIGPGSGVAGVAWNLEREFLALGHTVERFSYSELPGARRAPRSRLGRRVARARRVVRFSVVGTRAARRFLAERPHAVSLCHSEALAGDVFVSHGIESVATRTRARGLLRLLGNPIRTFTYLRERARFRSRTHSAVVVVSEAEAAAAHRVHRRVRPRVLTIPNGVDLERFHPPSVVERQTARAAFRLDREDRVALLIGHDLARKGVMVAIDALAHTETVLLLIVGGDEDSVAAARARADTLGVAARVLFAGTRTDIPLMMAASDVLILPSTYEANALVVLEALAAGLPVVATRVGYAPEIVVDGENGYLIDRDPVQLARRLDDLARADHAVISANARAVATRHGWRATADQYVALLAEIERLRGREGA